MSLTSKFELGLPESSLVSDTFISSKSGRNYGKRCNAIWNFKSCGHWLLAGIGGRAGSADRWSWLQVAWKPYGRLAYDPYGAVTWLGLVLGLIAAGLPASNINTAAHSPIHDVSTDTANPPRFVAVMAARNSVPHGNSADYDDKTAQKQREIYPDITPVNLDVPPAQAFDRALAAARSFGWEIVANDPSQGHIEATATTFWFGFKDDIVIRITPQGSGSRVDVRSLSRIGDSDVGVNAKRIKSYVSKLKVS
jgi:uncharacterized protein (DUF1499 family)